MLPKSIGKLIFSQLLNLFFKFIFNIILAVLILYATLHRPAHCVTFPTARDLCVGRVSGYSYPDLADCTKYTICYADRQETKSCDDLKYRYFSEEAQACVSHTNHCFQCPLVAFNEQRIKGYCNQFIRCIHGKPQYFTCSDGLLFDDDLDTCDVAHLVRNKCDPCPITDRNDYIFRPDPYHCDA